jgi:hypothetical protein
VFQLEKKMKSLNTFELIGASCTIVGSFLPWERAGDFVSFVTYGIRVYSVNFKYWITGIHRFPVYDNGGTLVILLTSAIILLALRPPRFVKKPTLWKLVISVLLMASSFFFVGRWLTHRLEAPYVIGAAEIEIGLISVMIGSALLLWMAILKYLEEKKLGKRRRLDE